jgi:hypothetical protein
MVFASSASATPTWLTTHAITSPAQQIYAPAAAADAAGDVFAAWVRFDGTNWIVEEATRTAGGSFVTKQLQTGTGQASNVTLAANKRGDVIVAWRRQNATAEIWAATRAAGGNFAVPQTIASVPSYDVEDPNVAVNVNGAMMVVWRLAGGSSYTEQIYGAFRPAGGSFTTAPISTQDIWNQSPRVVMDATGRSTVVWSYWDGSTNIARVRVRSANGTLGNQNNLSAGAPTGYPMFATVGIDSSGNALAVWSHWNGSTYDVQGATRTSSSDNWNNLPTFGQSAGASFGNEPQVAVDPSGNAVAIWRAADNTISAASRAAGGSFGTAQTGISAPTASNPKVLLDPNGQAIAIWQRSDADGQRIETATRPLGGSFGSVRAISSLKYANSPALGVDGLGNAIAVWAFADATKAAPNNTVQYSAYDASPPTLSVNTPSGGNTGQTLGFSASVFDVWSPVTTTWSFGDGTSATGNSVTHAYGGASAFNVVATARDAVGNATSTSRSVQITTPPPPGGGCVDHDGDGFCAGQDCNDNNPKINPSAKEIPGNDVDENCDGIAAPLPDLTSAVSPLWSVNGSNVKVLGFTLKGLKKGWKVTVTCKGPHCPFKSQKITNKKTKKGNLNALKKLKSRNFKAGQTLTVKFTAPGYNAKFSIFKFKKGKLPASSAKCQTNGTNKLRACRS